MSQQISQQNNGVPPSIPTQVWIVQGKAQNKAFRTALSLHRENATLNPETANVEEVYPQHNQPKKA
jgi:hypothetical protein